MAVEKPRSVAESPYRSAKWDEITEGRDFNQADAPLLAMLCQWHEINDTALEEIESLGGIHTAYADDKGNARQLPQIATMARASSEIREISKQLGLFKPREEKPQKPRAKVTALEILTKQRAQGPTRKPAAKVPNSA